MAVRLDETFFPAGVGTVSILISCVEGIRSLNVYRYAMKDFSHPYKPWAADQSDEKVYRLYRANENQKEWALYTIPMAWMYVLFARSLPDVMGFQLKKYVPWTVLPICLAFSHYNMKYLEAFGRSTEERLAPFYKRTFIFRILFTGVVAELVCCGWRISGLAKANLIFNRFLDWN